MTSLQKKLQHAVPTLPAGLLCGVALIAAAVPLYYIVAYGVDVPFWDQWGFTLLLDKAHSHTLTIGDLWEQHNVHRIFFPRLIMIGLARLTAWNVKWEMATNYVLSVILFSLLCYFGMKVAGELWCGRLKWALIPTLASISFSMSQWANYTWGWQIQILLSVGAVVAGFGLLSRCSLNIGTLTLASVFGVVASYSFGTGLVYWPIGLWLLSGRSDWPKRTRLIRQLVWVTIASLTIYLYAHDFEHPGPRALSIIKWADWFDYVRYIVAYLGSPIALFAPAAAPLVGLLGLAVFGVLFVRSARIKLQPEQTLRSVAGMGLYAIGCGLLTGIGRVSLGVDQALSSRYVTFGMLFWIAILLMAVPTLMCDTQRGGMWSKHPTAARRIVLAVILLLVGCVQISSAHEVPHMLQRHRKLISARLELRQMRNDRPLRSLLQNTVTLKQRFVPILKKWNLSVWRESGSSETQSGQIHTMRQPKREAAAIELK